MRYILTSTNKILDLKECLQNDPFFFQTTDQKAYLKTVYNIDVKEYSDKLDKYFVRNLIEDHGAYFYFSGEETICDYGEQKTVKNGMYYCSVMRGYTLRMEKCDEVNSPTYFISSWQDVEFADEIWLGQPELFNDRAKMISKVSENNYILEDNEFTKAKLIRPDTLIKIYCYQDLNKPELEIPGYQIEDILSSVEGNEGQAHSSSNSSGNIIGYKSLFSGAITGGIYSESSNNSELHSDKSLIVKYKQIVA